MFTVMRRERRFVRRGADFRPAYLDAHESGELAARVERALAGLKACRYCPRDCAVDRLADEVGVCRSGRLARVAHSFPHFGEEYCLRGWRGSGTIFFSCCSLRCVFCQNWDISWQSSGPETTAAELAGQMLELQDAGCHNINFVTPEHVVPQILEALAEAVPRGLKLPLVYNTSGYDSLESLRLLDGIVDIYMPDFKVWQPETARRLLGAADYPEHTRRALLEMHRQVGDLVFDERGIALRGLLVRHLVLPGELTDTREVMRFLAREVSPHTYVNVMDQYRPAGRVLTDPQRHPDLARGLLADEHAQALRSARQAGLHRFDLPERRRAALL